MAIKEITTKDLGKKKSGWRWDKKRELWVTFSVDTTFNGERHVRRGFLTERAAQDYIDELKSQEKMIKIGVVSVVKYPTVKQLFEKRLIDIENKSEKYRAVRVFKIFLALCGKDTTIEKITKNHFKQFADLRIKELSQKNESESVVIGHKRTVNREINPIARAFSSVKDYYSIPRWIKPEIFRFSVPTEGRTRLIEPGEYKKLLDYFLGVKENETGRRSYKMRRRVGLILQLALMTGLRHGEICGMQKAKLNRKRREIDVYRFKTKRWKMYSPLTDTMIYLLDEAARLYEGSDYFFTEDGKLDFGFYFQMKKACKKFGIPYGKKTDGGFVLHDARHTFSTILSQNLIDNKTSIEFTDNPTALSNYQHSTNESKKRAMNIIEKRFGNNLGDSKTWLKRIYDEVQAGKLSFENFEKEIESFDGYLTFSMQTDVSNVADVIDAEIDFVQ